MQWLQHWYPVAFTCDVGRGPHGFAVHERNFVLFRAADGSFQALDDVCPHRGARLSHGSVQSGRLECGYHGWCFGEGGRCLHIPQLARDQAIPERAHVAARPVVERQGLLWVWPGTPTDADPAAIPDVPDLDREGVRSVDFAIDLPYDQTFLVENVIDVAHIHVAHDGIRGGGLREMAAPIHFEIEECSVAGIRASFRSIGVSVAQSTSLKGACVQFRAPNLVHYRSLHLDDARIAGLALYSLPIGPRHCRLLYRSYSNFPRLRDRLRPRWLEHWTQCTILEQDMAVVVGQAELLGTNGRTPRELWLPLKTSDTLVLAYRRWLDEHASDWPYPVGFARSTPLRDRAAPFDRYTMHTALCTACSRACRWSQQVRPPLFVAIVVMLALAACLGGTVAPWLAAGTAIVAALALVAARLAERRFR